MDAASTVRACESGSAATRVWRQLVALSASFVVLVGIGGCAVDRPPTPTPSPTPSVTALGPAADEYIANGSVALRDIRAIVVSQGGQILAERYYGSSADAYLDVQSVTKSVTSTLVGIAIHEGRLTNLEQNLAQLLPRYRTSMHSSAAKITLRQLLTMTGGWNEQNNRVDLRSKGLVRRLLEEGPGDVPGRNWHYHDAGPHLLAAVLAEQTGMSVLDYARERLFGPLGIKNRPAFEGPIADADTPEVMRVNSFGWLRDPDGLHAGSHGLRLTGLDMLKIGQLYLDGGVWQGRRILSASYVAEATAIQKEDVLPRFGYGFLWWIPPLSIDRKAFFARGLHGQYITVVPELQLVVAVSTRAAETDPTFEDHLALIDSVIIPRVS